jgi:hypothetical protein
LQSTHAAMTSKIERSVQMRPGERRGRDAAMVAVRSIRRAFALAAVG